MLLCILKGCNL